MKAIRVEKTGGPEVLELQDVAPVEEPSPGQVIVRVVAAGVNFMDVQQRMGRYPVQLPFTPGVEGAGVVESVAEGVTKVKPGDRVAYLMQPGAYAEASAVNADRLIPLPDEFSFEEGAAFPVHGITAHYLIHEFRLPKKGCHRAGACCGRWRGAAAGAMGAAPGSYGDWDGVDRGEGAHCEGRGRRARDSLQ